MPILLRGVPYYHYSIPQNPVLILKAPTLDNQEPQTVDFKPPPQSADAIRTSFSRLKTPETVRLRTIKTRIRYRIIDRQSKNESETQKQLRGLKVSGLERAIRVQG